MQGTTTNGKWLLQFKTGAFLAGTPVQPVILKYDTVSPECDTQRDDHYSILVSLHPGDA